MFHKNAFGQTFFFEFQARVQIGTCRMPWVSWDFENAGLADEMGATMPPGTDGVIGAT